MMRRAVASSISFRSASSFLAIPIHVLSPVPQAPAPDDVRRALPRGPPRVSSPFPEPPHARPGAPPPLWPLLFLRPLVPISFLEEFHLGIFLQLRLEGFGKLLMQGGVNRNQLAAVRTLDRALLQFITIHVV